jgi:hypothetical protein
MPEAQEMPRKEVNQRIKVNTILEPGEAVFAGPQPQAVNQGRVDPRSLGNQSVGSNGREDTGTNPIIIVLAVILALVIAFIVYDKRAAIAGMFSTPVTTVDRLTADPTIRPPATIPAYDPRLAADTLQAARPNPIKEKYLADCAAKNAPVVQMPDGRLNCNVAPTVITYGGQLPPSLATAKTAEEYETVCKATRGARFWKDDTGRPRCTR